MEKQKEKNFIKKLWALCPLAHGAALVSAALILLHLLTRHNAPLMRRVSANAVRPLHRALSELTGLVRFSVAEFVITAFVGGVLVYIIMQIRGMRQKEGRGLRLYRMLMSVLSALLTVYCGYTLLWGVYYYGDDFVQRSGFEREKISIEQLETVTRYFAARSNEYSLCVERDGSGAYSADKRAILDKSTEVYLKAEKIYPCLEGPQIRAKGLWSSRLLSYMDFTGFFFPFTAEANLNIDFPPSMLPSTVAHELAHQRGVAKEQEANFVAVLSSLEYGDADYCYSACLLAYTHLGNALYSADYDRFEPIYYSLNSYVLRDFQVNRDYWKKFETPVQTLSTEIYDSFLKSYEQELGMKSYGACVDLLVNYYYEQALEYFEVQ